MIRVGDRFRLVEEDIAGVVGDIFYDERGEAACVIVEQDNGTWAAVDMSLVEPRIVN